jgi:hypothetical protein
VIGAEEPQIVRPPAFQTRVRCQKGDATRDHPDVRPRVTKEMVRMVVEE